MKNLKKVLFIIYILTTVIFPIFFYYSIYDVDDTNIEKKLNDYLEVSDMRIISQIVLNDLDDKYLIVNYENDKYSGISLLSKGINKKFQIRAMHQTTKEIAYVDYEIESRVFNFVFGKSDSPISTVNIKRSENITVEDINSKSILIVQNNSFGWGSFEINYSGYLTDTPKKVELGKKSIKKMKISKTVLPLFSFYLLAIILGLSIMFSSVKTDNLIGEDVSFDEDNRIKQMKPW